MFQHFEQRQRRNVYLFWGIGQEIVNLPLLLSATPSLELLQEIHVHLREFIKVFIDLNF